MNVGKLISNIKNNNQGIYFEEIHQTDHHGPGNITPVYLRNQHYRIWLKHLEAATSTKIGLNKKRTCLLFFKKI